ncbi:MAG: AclJ, partial [uncultured Thermomicrobiales bacterium]
LEPVQPRPDRRVSRQWGYGDRPFRRPPAGDSDHDGGQKRVAPGDPAGLHHGRRPRGGDRLQGRRPDPPGLVPQPGRQPGGDGGVAGRDLPGASRGRGGRRARPSLRPAGGRDALLRRVPTRHPAADPGGGAGAGWGGM